MTTKMEVTVITVRKLYKEAADHIISACPILAKEHDIVCVLNYTLTF